MRFRDRMEIVNCHSSLAGKFEPFTVWRTERAPAQYTKISSITPDVLPNLDYNFKTQKSLTVHWCKNIDGVFLFIIFRKKNYHPMAWGMRPIRSTDKCKCSYIRFFTFFYFFFFLTRCCCNILYFEGKIIGKIRREIYGLILSLRYFFARIFISFFSPRIPGPGG